MIALFVLAALLLIFAVTLAIRRARRRTAELEAKLLGALERRLGGDLTITDRHLSLAGRGYRLLRTRLLAVARRQADADAETVIEAASELLRQPLRPLPGSLSLKIHGPRISLHLVSPTVLDLMAPEPRLARRPEPALRLTATYRIDGRADQCVSEDHLRDQGIDTTDLHGIALAVLRQGFDDDLVRRVVGGARKIVESKDGTAAALILLLPDFLPPGAKVAASLDGPNRLVLEPWAEHTEPTTEQLRLPIDHCGWKVL